MQVKVITPPAVEPVTVEEVKLHTRVAGDVEDYLIAMWIRSARELIEEYQRRAIITQTLEVTMDSFPDSVFCLPRAPLQDLESFCYYTSDGEEKCLF